MTRRIFVFVGRLDAYQKPLDLVLLEAAPDGRPSSSARAPRERARRLLAARGLAARCRIIPQLPNESLHVYYHACDAFVNLNDQEIFGMSLLEPCLQAACQWLATRRAGPHRRGRPQWLWLCSTVPNWPRLWGTSRPRWALLLTTYQRAFSVQNSAELALTCCPPKETAMDNDNKLVQKPPTFTAACASA